MDRQQQAIEQLREAIEKEAGRKMKTPKDFDYLSEVIERQLHEHISSTTLKRMWGYLAEPVTPRISTLDILAQFLGHADWDAFCKKLDSYKLPAYLALYQKYLDAYYASINN